MIDSINLFIAKWRLKYKHVHTNKQMQPNSIYNKINKLKYINIKIDPNKLFRYKRNDTMPNVRSSPN